jgi:hypothetical protein
MSHTLEFVVSNTPGLAKSQRTAVFTHTVRELERHHVFNVDPTHAALLAGAWAEDCSGQGHPLCVHERLPPLFRFFVSAVLPADVCFEALVPLLHEALQRFLPDPANAARALGACCVAASPAVGGVVHARYIWPDFVVDVTQALTMRERLVAELAARDHECEAAPHEWRWHDILDYAAYTGDGPPLPGSCLYVPCAACHNRRAARPMCGRCMMRGVERLGHVLAPRFVFRSVGERTPLARPDGSHSAEHMLACSVLPPPGVAPNNGWARPAGTPYFNSDRNGAVAVAGAGTPRAHPPGAAHDFGASRRKHSEVSIPTLKLLEKAIRVSHARCHSTLIVTNRSVLHEPTKRRYVVSPLGVGCHTCATFRGEHADSRVYFLVTPDGVQQGCHSKDTLPSGHECRSKMGMRVRINANLRACLFPDAAPVEASVNPVMSAGYQMACVLADHHFRKIDGTLRRTRTLHGD